MNQPKCLTIIVFHGNPNYRVKDRIKSRSLNEIIKDLCWLMAFLYEKLATEKKVKKYEYERS